MERKMLDDEMLNAVNGGRIQSGWSNKRNCSITYITDDTDPTKITSPIYQILVSDLDWGTFVMTKGYELPTEEAIVAEGLKEGKIKVYGS